jgi:hypothetical protein
MNDVPLIFTTKGNLPVADLTYKHEWQEDDNSIMLIEEYYLGDELVRRNVHARLKQGLQSLYQQASI